MLRTYFIRICSYEKITCHYKYNKENSSSVLLCVITIYQVTINIWCESNPTRKSGKNSVTLSKIWLVFPDFLFPIGYLTWCNIRKQLIKKYRIIHSQPLNILYCEVFLRRNGCIVFNFGWKTGEQTVNIQCHKLITKLTKKIYWSLIRMLEKKEIKKKHFLTSSTLILKKTHALMMIMKTSWLLEFNRLDLAPYYNPLHREIAYLGGFVLFRCHGIGPFFVWYFGI